MTESRYLQRDATGKVVAHFANAQPYATECVPDDHPDLLAWRAQRVADKAAYMTRKALLNPAALLARIEALEKKNG